MILQLQGCCMRGHRGRCVFVSWGFGGRGSTPRGRETRQKGGGVVCVSPYTLSRTQHTARHTVRAHTHTRTRCQREGGGERERERKRERGRAKACTRSDGRCARELACIYIYVTHTHTHTHHTQVATVQVLRNGKVGWGVPKAGATQEVCK